MGIHNHLLIINISSCSTYFTAISIVEHTIRPDESIISAIIDKSILFLMSTNDHIQ
jgi:hypothetical protein